MFVFCFQQLHFLREHLLEVEMHIQPGLIRLNWNSLGIVEYSQDCHLVLKSLKSLVAQKEKIGQEVQAVIDLLEKFNFFYFEKCDGGPVRLSCKVNHYFHK
jgi:dynein heavy chain